MTERSAAAQIAALARWANEDPVPNARRAQQGLRDKYRREVIELAAAAGEQLTEAEVQRRAEARYKLHFARMRLLSAKVRSAKARAISDGRA